MTGRPSLEIFRVPDAVDAISVAEITDLFFGTIPEETPHSGNWGPIRGVNRVVSRYLSNGGITLVHHVLETEDNPNVELLVDSIAEHRLKTHDTVYLRVGDYFSQAAWERLTAPSTT